MACLVDINERPVLSQIEMEKWLGVGTEGRLERGAERKGWGRGNCSLDIK